MMRFLLTVFCLAGTYAAPLLGRNLNEDSVSNDNSGGDSHSDDDHPVCKQCRNFIESSNNNREQQSDLNGNALSLSDYYGRLFNRNFDDDDSTMHACLAEVYKVCNEDDDADSDSSDYGFCYAVTPSIENLVTTSPRRWGYDSGGNQDCRGGNHDTDYPCNLFNLVGPAGQVGTWETMRDAIDQWRCCNCGHNYALDSTSKTCKENGNTDMVRQCDQSSDGGNGKSNDDGGGDDDDDSSESCIPKGDPCSEEDLVESPTAELANVANCCDGSTEVGNGNFCQEHGDDSPTCNMP